MIKSSRRSRRGAPSAGLQALSQYLDRYIASPAFTALADETSARLDELAAIRYSIHIHGSRVTVSAVTGDADYSAEVERTFARF